MVILCSFKQNGKEGLSPWRVVASSLTAKLVRDLQFPGNMLAPLNQQLPHNKGENYDK